MLRLTQLSGFNVSSGDSRFVDQDIIYTPALSPWQTTFSATLPTDQAGLDGYTIRQLVPLSLLSTSGPVMRLTMQLNSFIHIDAMYIGEQASTGDLYDMKTSPAPAQILIAGSSLITGPLTGSYVDIVSDPLSFPIDKNKNYIITAHFLPTPGSNNTIRCGVVSGADCYLKSGVNEAATADVTGYSVNTGQMYLVSKIEVIVNMVGRMFGASVVDIETIYSSVATGGGGPQDIWWNNVVFITGYEGVTGSTEVTDGSPRNRGTGNIQGPFGGAPGGSVTQSRKKYGGASFEFKAATSLRWGSTGTDFSFGSGLFTIETWFYPNTTAGGIQSLISMWTPSNNFGWMLSQNANALNWTVSTTGSNILVDMAGGSITLGSWHHAAVDFDGVKYRLYLDGVMVGSSTVVRNIFNAFSFFAIGSNGNNDNYWFDGNLDETRVTKNIARYASDSGFTPPASAFIYAGGGGVAPPPPASVDPDTFYMPFVHTPGMETAAFLARTSGLDTTHVNAYTALINGLVADGVWYKLDVLHIYATQNSTTALLNLRSTNYSGVTNGSPVFTTDRGFTGIDSSSTVYINTGFFAQGSPYGTGFTLNTAHISLWDLTNVAVGGAFQSGRMGISVSGVATTINNRYSGDSSQFYINCNDGGRLSVASQTDGTGHWIANRSASNAVQGYRNGNSIGTGTGLTSNLSTSSFYTLSVNGGSGTATGKNCQLAMTSIGASLTSTDATNFYARLRTYMTAVGVP